MIILHKEQAENFINVLSFYKDKKDFKIRIFGTLFDKI